MSEKNLESFRNILKSLPEKPGVYQFFDENGIIIYVGKAKNLKKRISSYFHKSHEIGKVRVLVKKIRDIKHIVVDTETDALLLENNLIKKYQPRYNVMLKDDKSYPWICIKKEAFPRVFSARILEKDGSKYYGPYASVRMMKTLLDLIRQLFSLRTCKHHLSDENIKKKKYKICLEYHIGNCLGPCEEKQSAEDYNNSIQQIESILKGNISLVIQELKSRMKDFAANLEFEKAQIIKENLILLERYQSKSTVVSPEINNIDVFSIEDSENEAYINFLKIVNGAIIQVHTLELKKKLNESKEELLALAITEFRNRYDTDVKEIIVPFLPELMLDGINYKVPQRGDKKKLLELSERNAKFSRLEKEKQLSLVDPERHTKRIMERMQKDLRLSSPPIHIECFDNSNTQGTYPVAAMVLFRNGRPSKKEYRHFNIKTVEGPNDYASMEEVVYRRYKRMVEEKQSLPNLIIVDGGKGQLSSAVKSLEKLELMDKIAIIGIAKRLEELFYPGESIPMYLDKQSESQKIIQHLRDEAHRFGITHHRKKRQKGMIKAGLTDIPTIGSATSEMLLKKFKSIKRIKEVSLEDLCETVGKAKGVVIYNYFKKEL